MNLELHIYDFDGTLFLSPNQPEWWPDSTWIIKPDSLGPPCVPETPGAEWWLGRVVEEARQSISNPDVYSVLCTGRLLTPAFQERIPELLHQVGLDFDEVLLNPSVDTPAYKARETIRILHRYPGIEVVHIWEDSQTNIDTVTKAVESLGKTCVGHLIPSTVPPAALCDRVASRWVGAVSQRRAGRLEAPPLLVEEIATWTLSEAAANRIMALNEKIKEVRTQEKESLKQQEVLEKSLATMRKALRSRKSTPKELWELFNGKDNKNSVVAQAAWNFGFTGFGMPHEPGIKYREFFKLNREGKLRGILERMMDGLGKRLDGTDYKSSIKRLMDERNGLKKLLVSGYNKPFTDDIHRNFEVAPLLKGWKYEDVLTDQRRVEPRVKKLEQRVLTQKKLLSGARKNRKPRSKEEDERFDEFLSLSEEAHEATKAQLKALKEGGPVIPFDTITVVLTLTKIEGIAAYWQPASRMMKIVISTDYWQWDPEKLRNTIRHESQHFAQTFLSEAVGGKAGLPPKKLRTPQFQSWMQKKQPGRNWNDAEVSKAMQNLAEMGFGDRDVGGGRVLKRKTKDFDFHAMDDTEFFTRLDDAIENFTREATGQKEMKSKKVKNQAIDLFTNVDERPPYDVLGFYMGISPFFEELKRIPAVRLKWIRAVKEFRKALGYTGDKKIK